MIRLRQRAGHFTAQMMAQKMEIIGHGKMLRKKLQKYIKNHRKMLILYEITKFGLTYFYMTSNVILKTGNLSVCQAAK